MSVRTGDLLEPIAAELAEFERRLEATVEEDLGPMGQAMGHIVRAGGKRLRPALVLLSCGLGDADEDHSYRLAMAIEFIHTATLIHDDLIDNAETRRGLATIHAMLGANPAIIVGDYYFAKGANLMSSIGTPEIDEVLSRTVMTICMGELLQMTTKTQYEQSLDTYFQKIERKTATLLSACTYTGAVVAQLDRDRAERMKRYGYSLGMAFQIADDVLDYVATEDQVGKPVGADLRQGTVTLPLMLALEDEGVAPRLRGLLRHEPLEDADYKAIVALVRESNAIDRTEAKAHEFANAARAELSAFPPSRDREVLEAMCDYVVERKV